jgi:hypothetical protein
MPTVLFPGRQGSVGGQPVTGFGNLWNMLATGGISWQPVESVQRHGKLCKIHVKPPRISILELKKLCLAVCKCVPVRVLHFAANQYEARRLGKFARSEKHAPRTRFLFAQDCNTVNM